MTIIRLEDLARIEDPLARLHAWVDNFQADKAIEHAIRQLVIAREAPAPRVASVTPLPFAPPSGCSCGTPLPVLHGLTCPLFRGGPAEVLTAERDELLAKLASQRDELDAMGERATALETTGARLEKLVHARLGAREPALVELLACVDNAIARARMTPPGGPQPAIAAVPLAVFDALVAARDAIEDAPKPGADHG